MTTDREPPQTPNELDAPTRDQYLNKYIPGKLASGEVPRSVPGYAQSLRFWEMASRRGAAWELGIEKVFGLDRQGWERHHTHSLPESGRSIQADFYRDSGKAPDGVAHSIEVKSGEISQEREVSQLLGYRAQLARGEKVTYITRAGQAHAQDVRELMGNLLKQYPNQFRIMEANDRVYNRILDSGMRELERREKQRTRDTVARIPAKDRESRDVAKVARDYLASLNNQAVEGRQVGVEQIRYVQETLRDLGEWEHRRDLERADESRKLLGLGFRAGRDVTDYLRERADERHHERMTPVNELAVHQISRERSELAHDVARVLRDVERARKEGREIDPKHLQRAVNAHGNRVGALARLEGKIFEAPIPGQTSEQQREWNAAWKMVSEERDRPIHQALDHLDRVAAQTREARERVPREVREREARPPAEREVRERGARPAAEREVRERGEARGSGPPALVQVPAEREAREAQIRAEREQRAAERTQWMLDRGVDESVTRLVGLHQDPILPGDPEPPRPDQEKVRSDHATRQRDARARENDARQRDGRVR
ncbi:hypothetical protein [Nocardia puris]|uniref:Uncharacterized protein n=1 Tax=Nocardia puris TaxID=208602 RepID=A0A366DMR0_9NOCA|nr:hypothetical protein [Nocardia puris]RBO91336.1 hypothetical protein DFR74_10438 [Nocardia puris]